MAALTPREMRVISDHVERLTKARVVNQQLGVDTTPDLLLVRFPNGYEGTLIWTPGRRGESEAERRALERNARHRDGYHLDAATIRIAGPKPTTGNVHAGVVQHMAHAVQAQVSMSNPEEMRRTLRNITQRNGGGEPTPGPNAA